MANSLRSYIHVTTQFICIAFIIIVRNLTGNLYIIEILILAGIILGLWSAWAMRKSDLTIFPEPGNNFNLITHGPYKVIRHPMYTALFIVLIPLVVFDFSFYRFSVLIVFSINQILKLLYEEKLLIMKNPAYIIYMGSTWRLVPILF